MSTAQRIRGRSVSSSDLETLGKTAARLSETSGLSLTEACVRTLEPESLNAEQIRRVVEHCNVNAVNSKFAQLHGVNRIVHIDEGPADPMTVIDALNAATSAPHAQIMALEYSAAPNYEKRGHALPPVRATDVSLLRTRLKAAHDELADVCAGIEFRMELKLDALRESAKRAMHDGASLADLTYAWADIHPAMAKVAAQKLRSEIPWGVKTAGARVSSDHPVVHHFQDFVKVALEWDQASRACRKVESELARVTGFLSQQVS